MDKAEERRRQEGSSGQRDTVRPVLVVDTGKTAVICQLKKKKTIWREIAERLLDNREQKVNIKHMSVF